MDILNGIDELILDEELDLNKSQEYNNKINIDKKEDVSKYQKYKRESYAPDLRAKKKKFTICAIKFKNSYQSKDCKSNPLIYSNTQYHPTSFLFNQKDFGFDFKKNVLNAPSPIYIDYNELKSTYKEINKDNTLKGVKICHELGLVLTDISKSNKFKGILSKVMESAFYSMFNKNPICLPVKKFLSQNQFYRKLQNHFLLQKST